MAAYRPLLRLPIEALEEMFAGNPASVPNLQSLHDELQHRTTDRAIALRGSVRSALTQVAKQPERDTAKSASSERMPMPDVSTNSVTAPRATAQAPEFPPAQRREPPASAPTNRPESILRAWTALEALEPRTYRKQEDLAFGDRTCVAQLDPVLPWTLNETSRKNCQLYYRIILGSIAMGPASDALVQVFGVDVEERGNEQDRACLAAVLVTRQGLLVDEDSCAVSSFGWALPIALRGELDQLGGWMDAERRLQDGLRERFQRVGNEGEPLPVDAVTIQSAYTWLVGQLGLPSDLLEPPRIAIRMYPGYRDGPPDIELLNSFYLKDLARAGRELARGACPEGLSQYLGMRPPVAPVDLLAHPQRIEPLVAPSATPRARWPAGGGASLVTLQQAAVNAARLELNSRPGIVAVNGPPGTGKTTLLRDVVAGCILDRAIALSKFSDPATAFKTTGHKISSGGNFWLHLYRLDDSLKGHEVLVASTNNKAVENISIELPARRSVGGDIRYFRSIAQNVADKRADGATSQPAWGLIAAALGNARNRKDFWEALWWDDDRSLRTYLKAANTSKTAPTMSTGHPQNEQTDVPTVVREESPPSREQAVANWEAARKKFRELHDKVGKTLIVLEDARKHCLALPQHRARSAAAGASLAAAVAEHKLAATAAEHSAGKLAVAESELEVAELKRQNCWDDRPGFLSRLFRTARYREWTARFDPLTRASALSGIHLSEAIAGDKRAQSVLSAAASRWQDCEHERGQAVAAVNRAIGMVDVYRKHLGAQLVDEEFFLRAHEEWNLATPWIIPSFQKQREELFAVALELHRAFIDANAQKVMHNIGGLINAMKGSGLKEQEKIELLPELWSTLFLVCPVVSSTFASIDTMLNKMPPKSIGWLLIDEAGQATPQAAVGAIMRAQRSVVVGDPIQIQPVVTIPSRMSNEIAKFFAVSADDWFAPEASAQTLADRTSKYTAVFQGDGSERRVGIPLLVHRRCQEPMFSISNRIAYADQMVFASGTPERGPVRKALGPSTWFDIDGDATTKWCAAEGERVVQLLRQLADAGVQQPDLYLISPFKVVASELKRRLERETELFRSLGVDFRSWKENRIGTIHTFQGKEAEGVIAVLGAPRPQQIGARNWAAQSPNILNVMVSRAKQALYVVGSRGQWGGVGAARHLAAGLPTPRS